MKNDNWIHIFRSFKEIFEIIGKNISNNHQSLKFTNSEIDQLNEIVIRQKVLNGWFVEENVRKACSEIANMLDENKLIDWSSRYSMTNEPKNVLVIMAGNLPLVGFHDLICIWMSGNIALIKQSSDDSTLLPAILGVISEIHPEIIPYYSIEKGLVKNCDAVIATGGDNANLYFEKYFGHLPCLFRKNRTSIAIIRGDESKEDLINLGHDIFDYFGKGCRNVSFLLIPREYDLNKLFEAIVSFGDIINNKKYGNNYDYNRAIHLMNQIPILDNNFVLLKESNEIFSPISMIHYKRYNTQEEIDEFIEINNQSIQIIIGRNYIPFGTGQKPNLDDFADGINTMSWLNSLS